MMMKMGRTIRELTVVALVTALMAGATAPVFAVGVIADLDLDGVDDVIEDAVPSSPASPIQPTGDGNGDGILDSTQPQIVSLPNQNTGLFVTLNSTCSRFLNVSFKAEAEVGDDPGFDYPFGLFEFVTCNDSNGFCDSTCAAATVGIALHGVAPIDPGNGTNTYRKYGPTTPGDPSTNQFYDFSSQVFFGSAEFASFTLNLTDGALGDDTGVDGLIVDQGGPVLPATPAGAPAMGTTALGFGCLVLIAVAFFAFRRRANES